MQLKSKLAVNAGLALIVAGMATSGSCGEKWPAPPESEKLEMARVKKYEAELWEKIKPELAEWEKKGKPYLSAARVPTDLPAAPVPAFPGAEGGGKYSFGGRGGRVFVVTNLADSGAGTLREACEAAGPRTVVFNTSGIIHLTSPLFVCAPYLTIAGQSAPGDGICIAGRSTLIDTHDVVIRYVRFRRGQTNVFDRDDTLGGNPIGNIIVDHCSCSWGFDENHSMYRHMYHRDDGKVDDKLPTLNISLQYNISSEALNTFNHAFGGTWGGQNTGFHHNLFACNTARNASIGMGFDFNFVNNVLFNWRHRSLDGGDKTSLVNCINNYYKPGPVTPNGPIRHRIGLPQPSSSKKDPGPYFGKWYVSGNVVEGNEAVTKDNWAGGIQFHDLPATVQPDRTKAAADEEALMKIVRADKPFAMPEITTQTAAEAYETVLANAGDTLPRRDAVDLRIVQEVRTGKVTYEEGKGIITAIEQVGGYPEYKGTPFTDLGADGIPLWWKNKYKLDVKDANLASKDLQGDGYTVIEKYLNGLDPTQKIDWKDKRSNVNTLTAAAFTASGK